MNEQNKSAWLFGLIFLVAVVLGVTLYYWKQGQGEAIMTIQKRQYENAKIDRFSGNYGIAVEKFTGLVASAPDKETEGLNKIFLAESLYGRNENDDRIQAMKVYKSVVNDYKIPPRVRAAALNGIAGIIDSNDVSFYKLFLTEAPFNTFLPETGTDRSRVSKAYLATLKLSDETFPNSNAEYMIANYYAALAANNSLEDGMTAKEAAEIMQKYVSEGDALKDDSRYSINAFLSRYLNRAAALNISGKILGTKPEEREAGFKLAITQASPYETSNDQLARATIMRLRFFYATFLMINIGSTRYSDAKELLRPYETAATSTELWAKITRLYFINMQNLRAGSVLGTRAVELGNISPEFRGFLVSVGLVKK